MPQQGNIGRQWKTASVLRSRMDRMRSRTTSRLGSRRSSRQYKMKTYFRVHAVQRMFERNVSAKKVSQALVSGETIEDYSSEMPEPSRLVLGFQGKHPFHVVTSENSETNQITIITA